MLLIQLYGVPISTSTKEGQRLRELAGTELQAAATQAAGQGRIMVTVPSDRVEHPVGEGGMVLVLIKPLDGIERLVNSKQALVDAICHCVASYVFDNDFRRFKGIDRVCVHIDSRYPEPNCVITRAQYVPKAVEVAQAA